MSLQDFDRKQHGIKQATAEILKTMNIFVRAIDDKELAKKYKMQVFTETFLHDIRSFRHGFTKEEIADAYHHLVKLGEFNKVLSTYGNRLRDNYRLGFAGRHTVHGKRHYYPLSLDVEGVIDHSRCVDCEKPEAST